MIIKMFRGIISYIYALDQTNLHIPTIYIG